MTQGESIGQVVILHGNAFAESGSGTRDLSQGDSVYQGEAVVTGPGSAIEIRFNDDTLLSEGGDSRIELDKYVYNDDTRSGEVLFKMVQGTFRAVTGEIVDHNPENFNLQSPLATIGIRGTETGHNIPGGGQPEQHMILIFDGKPVEVKLTATGQLQILGSAGEMVNAAAWGLGPVVLMTPEQFQQFQELSHDSMEQGAPGSGQGQGNDGDDGGDNGDDGDDVSLEDLGLHIGDILDIQIGDDGSLILVTATGETFVLGGGAELLAMLQALLTDPGAQPSGDDTTTDDDGNDDGGGAGTEGIVWEGTAGADAKDGTEYADTMDGKAGNDTINGLGGDDAITGGAGADALSGGDGDDTFIFAAGDVESCESINGGDGTDTLQVDGNNDFTLASLSGVEKIVLANNVTAYFNCSDANGQTWEIEAQGSGTHNLDIHSGCEGETVDLSGLTFVNWDAADTVSLTGGANDDTLTGTSQNDIITPNAGTDTVDAGDGDDLIVMGAELTWEDTINGGDGTDTLTYTSTGEDTDALDGVTNVEKVVFGDADTWAAPCDSVVGPEETLIVDGSLLGANSALNFNGSQESNGFFSITGGAGDDIITGGQLADTISGAAGSDILVGGAGADTLTGGAGADYFKYYAAAQGGDSVSDFTHGTDFFSFADSSFAMLPLGALSEFNFSYEDAATYDGTTDFGSDATKGFVYCSESDPESGTGKLYYDPDSTTVGGETLIAVVTETNGDVTNTDITIFEYAV